VLLLIKHYEDQNYPIPKPDPIDAAKSKMADLGLKNQYFIDKIGFKRQRFGNFEQTQAANF